jgi:hypothetical protein
MTDSGVAPAQGMSARTAAAVRNGIIAICALALAMIFQPFSQRLFTIGCGLVVFGGLAFNLVPLCEKGTRLRSVVIAGLIVVIALFVIVGLAILSAWLYGLYFVRHPGQ